MRPFYYNKKAFEKAGITEEPKTYDELLAAAEKLKAAGIPAFTFGGKVNWHVMRLMDVILKTKCGIEKHDKLMKMELKWTDEPCATESFAEMDEVGARTISSRRSWASTSTQSFNLFIAGRAAMMLEGDWLVGTLTSNNASLDDYSIFPFPTGTDRLYGFRRISTMSARKSQHPDLAAKFLDYFSSDAGAAGHARQLRRPRRPTRTSSTRTCRRSARNGLTIFKTYSRSLHERRPGVSARRDDGVFPRHQRCRLRATFRRPKRRSSCRPSSTGAADNLPGRRPRLTCGRSLTGSRMVR